MNAARFLIHVQFQQRVSECRAALTDAANARQDYRTALNSGYAAPGTLFAHRQHAERLGREFATRLEAIQEEQQDKLWSLGLIAPGLPR